MGANGAFFLNRPARAVGKNSPFAPHGGRHLATRVRSKRASGLPRQWQVPKGDGYAAFDGAPLPTSGNLINSTPAQISHPNCKKGAKAESTPVLSPSPGPNSTISR